jgi:hypothetical protein
MPTTTVTEPQPAFEQLAFAEFDNPPDLGEASQRLTAEELSNVLWKTKREILQPVNLGVAQRCSGQHFGSLLFEWIPNEVDYLGDHERYKLTSTRYDRATDWTFGEIRVTYETAGTSRLGLLVTHARVHQPTECEVIEYNAIPFESAQINDPIEIPEERPSRLRHPRQAKQYARQYERLLERERRLQRYTPVTERSLVKPSEILARVAERYFTEVANRQAARTAAFEFMVPTGLSAGCPSEVSYAV